MNKDNFEYSGTTWDHSWHVFVGIRMKENKEEVTASLFVRLLEWIVVSGVYMSML